MSEIDLAQPANSIPEVETLRANAKALRSWFDSVGEQQRDDILWGRYSTERRAEDALDCAFRLAASLAQALEATAAALSRLSPPKEVKHG
ncbi:hypothetical protein TomTYG75_07350 [Sphingobium sp. TomTYG75]